MPRPGAITPFSAKGVRFSAAWSQLPSFSADIYLGSLTVKRMRLPDGIHIVSLERLHNLIMQSVEVVLRNLISRDQIAETMNRLGMQETAGDFREISSSLDFLESELCEASASTRALISQTNEEIISYINGWRRSISSMTLKSDRLYALACSMPREQNRPRRIAIEPAWFSGVAADLARELETVNGVALTGPKVQRIADIALQGLEIIASIRLEFGARVKDPEERWQMVWPAPLVLGKREKQEFASALAAAVCEQHRLKGR